MPNFTQMDLGSQALQTPRGSIQNGFAAIDISSERQNQTKSINTPDPSHPIPTPLQSPRRNTTPSHEFPVSPDPRDDSKETQMDGQNPREEHNTTLKVDPETNMEKSKGNTPILQSQKRGEYIYAPVKGLSHLNPALDSKGVEGAQSAQLEKEDKGYLSDGSDMDPIIDYHALGALSRGHPMSPARLANFSNRKKQAFKRLKQHRDYTVLMEERVRILEKEVGELLNKDPDDLEGKGEFRNTKPEIQKLTWDGYKQMRRTRKTQGDPYAIEVLLEEPKFEFLSSSWVGDAGYLSDDSDTEFDAVTGELPHTSLEAGSAATVGVRSTPTPIPERIRLNSVPLIRIVGKLREVNITDDPVTFHRPFRLLQSISTNLRRWRVELEKLFGTVRSEASTYFSNNQDNTSCATTPGSKPRIQQAFIDNHSDEWTLPKNCPKGTVSERALIDLNLLLKVIDDIQAYARSGVFEKGGEILFKDLWFLFKPGDLVYEAGADGETPQAYKIFQVSGVRHSANYTNLGSRGSQISIHCKYMDSHGRHIGPVTRTFNISRFNGKVPISSLAVYPFRFAKDEKRTQEMLFARGRKFLNLLKIRHVQSKGTINALITKEIVDSQIVVDFQQALQHHDSWKPTLDEVLSDSSAIKVFPDPNLPCVLKGCCVPDDGRVWSDNEIDISRATREVAQWQMTAMLYTRPFEPDAKIRDEEVLLFHSRVFGFILRNRKWARFRIDDLVEIVHRKVEDSFNRLILPKKHKETLTSLVEQHFELQKSTNQDEEQIDIIRGKGKGLIILLHGAPGVGKTSTAECIAEKFRKPLYPITCGDLGITPTDVENKLELAFTLAHRWGCILLLDEADIFLGERTREDFTRNSLVSVFLRVMEYYSGILFLTTNRVGSLDEAFKSRIHLSLHYRPLDWTTTEKIWKMNLKQIENRRINPIKVKTSKIMAFADENFNEEKRVYPQNTGSRANQTWNGRQIRNAFQTAIALAESAAKKKRLAKGASGNSNEITTELAPKHFQAVLDASQEFDRYMEELYQKSDARRAFDRSLRNDDFEQSPSKPRLYRSATEHYNHQQTPTGPFTTSVEHHRQPPSLSARSHTQGPASYQKNTKSSHKSTGRSRRSKRSKVEESEESSSSSSSDDSEEEEESESSVSESGSETLSDSESSEGMSDNGVEEASEKELSEDERRRKNKKGKKVEKEKIKEKGKERDSKAGSEKIQKVERDREEEGEEAQNKRSLKKKSKSTGKSNFEKKKFRLS